MTPLRTDRQAPRPAAGTGLATRLLALADRVRRLPPPSHRDPEAFHVARSELAAELRRLAAETEPAAGATRPTLATLWRKT